MKNKVLPGVLMLFSMLCLNPSHAATDNPEAIALVKSLLITEDDYLPFVKDETRGIKLKAALASDEGSRQSFDTFWTKDNKSYVLMYTNLIADGTAINATLFVSNDEMEFNKISSELPEGARLGIRNGGSSVEKIELLKPYANYTMYYRVLDPEGKNIGNLVFVTGAKHFLMFSVFGPTVFEDAESIDKLLSGKIEKAMTFMPDGKSPNFLPK